MIKGWNAENRLIIGRGVKPGQTIQLSAAGKHLGTIIAPKHPHNMAWGGADGKTLYMTAQGTLYRMPLKISGIRPGDDQKLAAQR